MTLTRLFSLRTNMSPFSKVKRDERRLIDLFILASILWGYDFVKAQDLPLRDNQLKVLTKRYHRLYHLSLVLVLMK